MTEVLRLRSVDDLVASVPHLLGFNPVESMVCLALGEGPAARVDLPGPLDDLGSWTKVLTDVYRLRCRPTRIALVAFGSNRGRCVEALAALTDALVKDNVNAPAVAPVLWVNDGIWTDALTGAQGTIDPSSRARMDAEFALHGRVMPATTRADLARALHGDPSGVARHLPTATTRLDNFDQPARTAEAEWVAQRVGRFRDDRSYVSDRDAARVLAAIVHCEPRNSVLADLNIEDAAVDSECWRDLLRRAPTAVRDTPATLLALTSYLEGRGAQTWVALDQLSKNNPLADLVASALEQAIDPHDWIEALATSTTAALQRAALTHSAGTHQSTALQEPRHLPPPTTNIDPDRPEPSR